MTLATSQDLFNDLRRTQLLTHAQIEPLVAELAHCRTAKQVGDELVARQVLTQFQVDQILGGFGADLVLGPYRLLEPVGEGGMGYVFKAYHSRLNRTVALKMIRDDLVAHQPDVMKRFLREAQAVASLMHPNIVVLFDSDEINGISFLAMEFIDGTDLAKMVQQQGPLPIPLACDYIRQAAQGLQHAYEAGLVHRDIKPSNLVVTRAGVNRPQQRRSGPGTPTPTPGGGRSTNVGGGLLKILDMGLARLTIENNPAIKTSTLTQDGSVIGTPDFMAPEQILNASSVDIRADLYSLGCTFYFLLTGMPPFPHGSPAEKLAKHQLERPAPLESIRRSVPTEVLSIVYRLMEKRPDSRYQTPQDLVNALNGITVRPAAGSNITYQPEIVVARSSSIALPATQAFGLDTLALPARKTAMIQSHGATTYVTALAFSPDSRLLATGGLDGAVNLFEIGNRYAEVNNLRGHLGEVQALAFSPTQPFLVSGSAAVRDGHMWRWDYKERDATKNRVLFPDEPFRVDTIAFSRDGKTVAASADMVVLFWSVGKRHITRETVLKGHGSPVKAFAFSPDGKRVAMACEDSTVRVWEFGWFTTKQKCVFTAHKSPLVTIAYSPTGPLVAASGPDRDIFLWDTSKPTGAAQVVLKGHQANVRLVQFGPRGDLILSVADGGQVILWDVKTETPVREWQIDKTMAFGLAVSPDLRYLATGMNDGSVHVYDMELMLMDQLPKTRGI